MKQFILLFMLFFVINLGFAQGNLQYNATKLIMLNKPVSLTNIDTTIVIPAGKTWKVEKIIVGEIYGSRIYMNGALIAQYTSMYNSSPILNSVNGPLWLPEGTYIFSYYSGGGINSSDIGLISALEFNITP